MLHNAIYAINAINTIVIVKNIFQVLYNYLTWNSEPKLEHQYNVAIIAYTGLFRMFPRRKIVLVYVKLIRS